MISGRDKRVVALQLIAMFRPVLGGVLGTSPVSTGTLWFCLAAAASTVLVTEVTKHVVRRRQRTTRHG